MRNPQSSKSLKTNHNIVGLLYSCLHRLESVCNKVVCFTHSTPAIHGLPEFTSTDSINDSIAVEVKKIIYDDVRYNSKKELILAYVTLAITIMRPKHN